MERFTRRQFLQMVGVVGGGAILRNAPGSVAAYAQELPDESQSADQTPSPDEPASNDQAIRPLRQESTPAPASPETALPFPKEIGDLARDGVMIHNLGTKIGVIDNQEDPQNNWPAIVDVARRFTPGDRFEFFFYDDPGAVPLPPGPQKYDTNINWAGEYPGAQNGKQLRIQQDGVWQWHISLPSPLRSEDVNKFNGHITSSVLRFFISKDNVATRWGDDFAAVLRQHSADPYNSGRMNFSLKVVLNQL